MKRKESNLFLYTIYTGSESASPQMVKYSNISFQSLFILDVQGLDTDSPQGYWFWVLWENTLHGKTSLRKP